MGLFARRNRKGSSIISALVVMVVLLLLGMAVVTVSMGALKTNAVDASNNDAFYAAKSAVESAIEQIKYEVSSYYTQMLTAQSADYPNLYSNFFNGINSSAQLHFDEPAFKDITTETTFSMGSFDPVNNVCEFLISSTATVTADGMVYSVNGKVFIKKVDVSAGSTWFNIDDAALKAGGTLYLGKKNTTVVHGGNIQVSEISYTRSWLPYKLDSGYQLTIDPNTALSINDCLTYPEYSDPVISHVDYYFTSSANVNWAIANVLEEGFGMETAAGVDLHIENCTVPDGVVYSRGDTHINNCTCYAEVYSDGDMHVNNQSIYGDIHCRGDLEINNANVYGDVYCDGNVTFTSAHMEGSIFADGDIDANNGTLEGSLFATGTITAHSLGVDGGIVYAHTKLIVGNMNSTGLFFSGGDIELTHSMAVNGAMIAVGDIYFSTDSNKNLTVNYSHSTIEDIISNGNNEDIVNPPGGEPNLDENVFLGQDITAIGSHS